MSVEYRMEWGGIRAVVGELPSGVRSIEEELSALSGAQTQRSISGSLSGHIPEWPRALA